jgi:hypothetical protein
MQTDAEFERWLDELGRNIRQICRRAARRFAAMLFAYVAVMIAVAAVILRA